MQIQKSYEINKNIIVTHKMAKKEETRTSIDELNESLSSIEQKVENNKNYIYWVCGAIVVIAAAIVGYIYGIRNPGIEGAQSEISQADMQLAQGNDSIALAQYMAVADGYSNSVANRANLNAAILLYNDGKYDEAIGYISNFDPEGVIIGPASQSLLGDCYVNTGKLDEALAAYDKAIALSADNSYYTPLFMVKKATIYREQKNYAAEADIFQSIKDKYPDFSRNYNFDVDKYLDRAKAMAGK